MSHDPLDAVIAAYMLAVEAGDVPNRQELLGQHPEHADALRAFFADLDRLDRVASPLRVAGRPDETGATDCSGHTALPTVRYFGDYELLEEIARGGMGIVYKARQVSLNRLVALKMILAGSFASSREVQRFRSEAEAAANLDHPHIVPIYEVGEHEGQQYYSMKFVEGTSLAKHQQSDPRHEVEGMIGVTRAVHHAHQRGVLHRDLKPSNVLVDSGGTWLVTDFGLAKRLAAGDGSFTETGQVLGTPKYMAPEQAAGRKDLTVAADVYSLGVILYERLTGQTPFTGDNALTLLRHARESEPPRPSSIRPGLDRDLETVVLKCLEKEPGRRYPSAEALVEDMEHWLKGEPITARAVGQAERFWRWCKRNPAIAIAAAAAMLALALTVALSTALAITRSRAAYRLNTAYKKSEYDRGVIQDYAARLLAEQTATVAGKEQPAEAIFRLVKALELAAPNRNDTEQSIRRALAATMISFPDAAGHLTPDDSFICAAFSPDGQKMATGKQNGHVRIWETASGKLLGDISVFDDGMVDHLTFAPGGHALSATNGREVRSWSVVGDRPLGPPIPIKEAFRKFLRDVFRKFSRSAITNVDGKSVLLVAHEYREGTWFVNARLWEISTGKPAGPEIVKKLVLQQWEPTGEDGRILVPGDAVDDRIEVIDARTGAVLHRKIPCKGDFRLVTLSPDNTLLAACENDRLAVYDAVSGRQLRMLSTDFGPGNVVNVPTLLFSRDSQTLLVSEFDSLNIWDVQTWRKRVVPIPFNDGGWRPEAFSSEGVAPINCFHTTCVLDTSSGRILNVRPTWASIVFEPVSSTLLISNSELWSLSPIEGSTEVVRLWAEVLARSQYRVGEGEMPLDESAWQARRQALERLIQGAPVSEHVRHVAADRFYWVRREVSLLREGGRWRDEFVQLTRLANDEPHEWRHQQRLGELLGGFGRYREAVAAFQRARQIGEQVTEDEGWWSSLGLCLLASGDEQCYRELRREMMERTVRGHMHLSIVLLTAGSSPLADGPEFKRLSDLLSREGPLESIVDGALVLARSGRYGEALKSLQKFTHRNEWSVSSLSLAQSDYGITVDYLIPFMAIMHHHLGHRAEANEYLARALSTLSAMKTEGGPSDLHSLAVRLVTLEAKALVQREEHSFPQDPFAH